MGYLVFDGVNDIVTFSSAMTGNAGASAYTMRVKSGPSGITLPASGLAAFIGTSTNSAQTGIMTNSAGRLMIYTSASLRYGSTNGFIQSGVPFDITLTHNADGTWDFYDNINGVTNSSGTFATSTSFGNLNCFGRASSTNATHLQGQIEFIEVTGLANSEKWDANLSGGTGSVLPTVSGNNNGTLVNFPTDGSQWGGFGSSATLSFAGTLPKLTASSTLVVAASVSLAGALPKLSASATISVLSAASVSFSGVLPKLAASALINVVPASIAISVSGSLPKLRSSISVNATQLPVLSFSGAMPRLRMSAALVSVKPLPTGDTLAIKQALVNARRAEENRNNEYMPPVVVVPEWWIIQQQALGLKQSEVNRARESEE